MIMRKISVHSFFTKLLKPRASYAKWLLALLAASFLTLGFMDYLKPIENYLSAERFSFRIGDFRFSLFLLLKGAITLVVLFWLTGIISQFGEKRIKNIQGIRAGNKALITKAFQIILYFLAFFDHARCLGH